MIVMEYCDGGDLLDILGSDSTMDLKLSWALEVAQGINALHSRSPPVAHRDLKSANVFITKDLHCKVADFDMAIEIPYKVDCCCGTAGFIAPEMLQFKVRDSHQCWSWSS